VFLNLSVERLPPSSEARQAGREARKERKGQGGSAEQGRVYKGVRRVGGGSSMRDQARGPRRKGYKRDGGGASDAKVKERPTPKGQGGAGFWGRGSGGWRGPPGGGRSSSLYYRMSERSSD